MLMAGVTATGPVHDAGATTAEGGVDVDTAASVPSSESESSLSLNTSLLVVCLAVGAF